MYPTVVFHGNPVASHSCTFGNSVDQMTETNLYHLGRLVKEKKVFDVPGTFQSMYAAQRWLKDRHYTYGSGGRGNDPVAIRFGEYDLPQKWHNINDLGRRTCDGVMYYNREGEATIYIFKQ